MEWEKHNTKGNAPAATPAAAAAESYPMPMAMNQQQPYYYQYTSPIPPPPPPPAAAAATQASEYYTPAAQYWNRRMSPQPQPTLYHDYRNISSSRGMYLPYPHAPPPPPPIRTMNFPAPPCPPYYAPYYEDASLPPPPHYQETRMYPLHPPMSPPAGAVGIGGGTDENKVATNSSQHNTPHWMLHQEFQERQQLSQAEELRQSQNLQKFKDTWTSKRKAAAKEAAAAVAAIAPKETSQDNNHHPDESEDDDDAQFYPSSTEERQQVPSHLYHLARATQQQFPPGSKFDSVYDLMHAISAFASDHGFDVVPKLHQSSLVCGASSSTQARAHEENNQRACSREKRGGGCSFQICFRPITMSTHSVSNQRDSSSNNKNDNRNHDAMKQPGRDNNDGPIQITEASCYRHGRGCYLVVPLSKSSARATSNDYDTNHHHNKKRKSAATPPPQEEEEDEEEDNQGGDGASTNNCSSNNQT
jgi:hypothetical protein